MAGQRRGLGRGLGALIPQEDGGNRPRDVYWPKRDESPAVSGDSAGRDQDAERGAPRAASAAGTASNQGPSEPKGSASTGGTRRGTGGSAVTASNEPADTGIGARLVELAVDEIVPNPRQPREVFDEDDLQELAHSIRELGVMQPVVVRRVGEAHELIMGERRLRATRLAGLETIPAILRETGDDEMLREALLENLHRVQLNPLEEAAAYGQLLEDFGCTHDELAKRLGRSRPRITNSLRLLKLPPSVARRVAAGVLSAGHARALLGLEDGAAMERMAQRVVAEGMSVRGLEELIALGVGGEGDSTETPRRRPQRRSTPEHEELAADLSDRWDTRVSVKMGRTKGTLTVEFAGQEDLDRILTMLVPED
ncbi:ParB/RepB/Spo0J family partition protein [Kytococcus sedentarius]|uniref:Chromosome segregation DNA-binding protein n=1 Tax=Kytococcus sedentarius (strain ATCC 14392 / DSM 20547 / JCM 11482 / CCUG 33030 / NBRC 15357 / NCTC 11040 / CCM 314 / 541) TaxID=478801 RepID=C7NH73_KYTSD|nr:ParB/RepB/Spo0J family partition protein [Kytococcus sedentarius]ACV07646.1 chromosome segregation DNA-binding protein [Kytococcus sedentarius DSM 20547]QQB63571.1 ParB/RepB/Spo0J family partition protein [Kytococcus sedentarius]STX13503.1 Probable chromosome-partitioning protein parB [Kytococcus sedentarius]